MKAQNKIYLCDSAFLNVIKINDVRANLVLSTSVVVNTSDNSTEISYSVKSWDYSSAHAAITKTFDDYKDAYAYYNDIYNLYKD